MLGGLRRDSTAIAISILNASDFWTKSLAVAIGLSFASGPRTRSCTIGYGLQNPEGMEPFAVNEVPQTRVRGWCYGRHTRDARAWVVLWASYTRRACVGYAYGVVHWTRVRGSVGSDLWALRNRDSTRYSLKYDCGPHCSSDLLRKLGFASADMRTSAPTGVVTGMRFAHDPRTRVSVFRLWPDGCILIG